MTYCYHVGVLAFESRKGGKHSHPQQQHYQQDLDVVVCSIGSALTEEKVTTILHSIKYYYCG